MTFVAEYTECEFKSFCLFTSSHDLFFALEHFIQPKCCDKKRHQSKTTNKIRQNFTYTDYLDIDMSITKGCVVFVKSGFVRPKI